MAILKNILLLQIIFIYINNIYCSHKKSITRIHRFDVCYCAENCIVEKFESQLRHPDRENTLMQLKFNLTEDVPKIKILIVPQKCKNKDALDSCESVSTFYADNGCTIMDLKDTMWSPFVYSFNPPFKCPFKKGLYISENSSFDADMYGVLPLQGWSYKSRLELYNRTGKNLLWSFCFEFSVVKVF